MTLLDESVRCIFVHISTYVLIVTQTATVTLSIPIQHAMRYPLPEY